MVKNLKTYNKKVNVKRLKEYNKIVKMLNNFEGNSHYDDALIEFNYNVAYCIYTTKLVLKRILEEVETIEELNFYSNMLTKLKNI